MKNTHTPGPDIDVRKVADGYMISQGVRSIGKIYAYNEREARVYASAPDLLAALEAMLRLVDGLPWQTRDAVYKAFNERTGGLPGSLPKPIAAARAAIAKARAK